MLTAIFEADFLDNSYGYRPKRSAKDAVNDLRFNLQFGKYGYIVEADIKGFFDHMGHEWLLRMLKERIDDAPFLNLVQKWLKAGILDTDGKVIHPVTGTPQGGLCKALHKPPYAKKVIMQSNHKINNNSKIS